MYMFLFSSEEVAVFLVEHMYLIWIALGVLILTQLILTCVESCRRSFPINILLYYLMVLSMSYTLAVIMLNYDLQVIFFSVIATCVLCFTIALVSLCFGVSWNWKFHFSHLTFYTLIPSRSTSPVTWVFTSSPALCYWSAQPSSWSCPCSTKACWCKSFTLSSWSSSLACTLATNCKWFSAGVATKWTQKITSLVLSCSTLTLWCCSYIWCVSLAIFVAIRKKWTTRRWQMSKISMSMDWFWERRNCNRDINTIYMNRFSMSSLISLNEGCSIYLKKGDAKYVIMGLIFPHTFNSTNHVEITCWVNCFERRVRFFQVGKNNWKYV
jgi:hypothetical protein